MAQFGSGRYTGGVEVPGSNPGAPTSLRQGFGWQADDLLVEALFYVRKCFSKKAGRRSFMRRRPGVTEEGESFMTYVYLLRSEKPPEESDISFLRSVFELDAIKSGVLAIPFQQLLVGAALYNFPVIDKQDFLGLQHR